ncbi:hypothetical protein SCHPADRAFT_851864 [Schizopora paradoxa]|uniref:RING-CH-type domain-containing protein n=1 Tax=Schizopora paradoxa TaxID=27342 RepID=A0A0H2RQ48_9AGAM|nr:hypothetical protein SCHPADRAFT_851864 [Schizopora paradoxa]
MSQTGGGTDEADQKQCRICLDGPDPELGRLIKPCLCKGSISYVHVKCLQRWRTTSVSKAAFFACPQCHYRYHFARTNAYGIATNPLFVGVLATTLFTILVYFASFLATFFLDNLDDTSCSSYGHSFYFGFFGPSPLTIAKDIIKLALRFLQDENLFPEDNLFSRSPGLDQRTFSPPKERGVISSFFRRVIIGIPVVGAASLVQLLWSVSMLTPFHFFTNLRGRNRRDRRGSRDFATILVLFAVVMGVLRALWAVYRRTESLAKYLLYRAEDAILEVN